PPPAPQAPDPAPAPRAEAPPAPRATDSPAAEPRAQAVPEVAAVAPGRGAGPAVPDIRSLGRGGGAGGRGLDRGGIEGEPIPLESKDPRFNDYFEKIRQAIKSKWGYPCVKQGVECDYKTTELIVEFGISKDGRLMFVNLMSASRWQVYDDYALNAIRLAAPFPPVPPPLLQGNGLPIAARFSYVVERGFTNILR
ncbi:MAG: TonB C-terminal domain-containing protein, partial [Candidatus Rokuibacteriota bacterium]